MNCSSFQGDNIETAISVAKECEIITTNRNCMLLTIEPPTKTLDAQVILTPLSTKKMNDSSTSIVDIEKTHGMKTLYVTNGLTWSLLRQYFPDKLPLFVRNGVVFARMSSIQKQQLVQELQSSGKYVGKAVVKMLTI